MKPTILCKNQYTIRKVDASGKETVEATFHNVPLQNFYDAVIGRWMGGNNQSPTSCIHSCWFGTGSAEPTGSETGLQTPLWTYGWNDSNVISWEKYLNEENHICHKYTFKIAADAAHVGTVSEVGIEIITGKGYCAMGLATRALILDAEGNPMTITKTDLEVLYVDVIFEFTLQDSENFKWIPENYMGYGSRSGTSWGPIFTLGLIDRIFFLGHIKENGFNSRLVSLAFSKTYQNNNHEMSVTGARLQQTVIPTQRYIKGIAVGSNSGNVILGYWKLPNADVIPPKVLSGMQVGVGDGETVAFNAPIAEWVRNSEEVFVNDIQQVRGVDYICSNDANAQGLCECSVLQDMEYTGAYTTAPQNVITPIIGNGPYVNGSYRTALWNKDHPTLTYAFPEDGIKAIKRFAFKNFIAYSSISSGGASYNSNWSNAYWTVRYSNDGEEWTDAGTVTIVNNVAELSFDTPVTARYWSFTISNRITGILFAAQGHDSLMAWGDTKPITFTNPPAEGAVIKMNATVNCPMKNENFIIDVNPTFQI